MKMTTEETTTNPIYHYRASDDLGEEAWGTLRDSLRSSSWEDVKEQLKDWEAEFKTATGMPIPGAYRSAKSVLKNAMILGLPYAGSAKTALEKLIKAKKEADKEEISPEEKLDKLCGRAYQYAVQNNLPFRADTGTQSWIANGKRTT